MLDFAAFTDSAPIPAVSPEDLGRVWQMMHARSDSPRTGYAAGLIADQCLAENADPIAVWARSSLVDVLNSQGLLSEWQGEKRFTDVVFEVAATLPLPHGVAGFQPGRLPG